MVDVIETYKKQAHTLVDSIYDVLADSTYLKEVKRVSKIKRGYGIDVIGDYERVVLTLDDTWLTHRITYRTDNEVIELRGDGVFIQQTITKGAGNYYKLTRLIDDLVSVIERWRDIIVK